MAEPNCRPDPHAFDICWDALAEQGLLDAYGGAEWGRIRVCWEWAGCPQGVASFIRREANKPPDGPAYALLPGFADEDALAVYLDETNARWAMAFCRLLFVPPFAPTLEIT